MDMSEKGNGESDLSHVYLTSILHGKLDEIAAWKEKKQSQDLIDSISDGLIFYIKQLRKFKSGPKRAKEVHRVIDSLMDRELKNKPELAKQIQCKKGCSFCCHQIQIVSQDEAMLLAKRAENLNIDLDLLEQQSNFGNDVSDVRTDKINETEWFKQPFEKSKCVFLNEKKECMVYEDRPTSCRVYNVISPPKECSPEKSGIYVAQVFLLNAQVLASASLNLQKDPSKTGAAAGYLPHMLTKFLKKKKRQKIDKGENVR